MLSRSDCVTVLGAPCACGMKELKHIWCHGEACVPARREGEGPFSGACLAGHGCVCLGLVDGARTALCQPPAFTVATQ